MPEKAVSVGVASLSVFTVKKKKVLFKVLKNKIGKPKKNDSYV
jgi:hypothetical protein